MEILFGIVGFFILLNLAFAGATGVGFFAGLFGLIFDPFITAFTDLPPLDPDKPPKRFSGSDFIAKNIISKEGRVEEWEEDTFVGWCSLPDVVYHSALFTEGIYREDRTREFDEAQRFIHNYVLPEISKKKSKEEDRSKWFKQCQNHKESSYQQTDQGRIIAKSNYNDLTRPITLLEVYRRKNGTYYAWPDTIAMNIRIDRDGYDLVSAKKAKGFIDFKKAEALMFYYDMPYVIFNKDYMRYWHNDHAWKTAKFIQIIRGSRPLYLERCRKDDPKISSYGGLANAKTDYVYRVLSTGDLRVFKVRYQGWMSNYLNIRENEITEGDFPGCDRRHWGEVRYKADRIDDQKNGRPF